MTFMFNKLFPLKQTNSSKNPSFLLEISILHSCFCKPHLVALVNVAGVGGHVLLELFIKLLTQKDFITWIHFFSFTVQNRSNLRWSLLFPEQTQETKVFSGTSNIHQIKLHTRNSTWIPKMMDWKMCSLSNMAILHTFWKIHMEP